MATTIYSSGTSAPIHGLIAPQAWYSSSADKTFVVIQGDGYDPYAFEYDHAAGSWSSAVKIGDNPLVTDSDEHGAPAIARDATGTLHVFWGVHGINGSLHHATSDSADDISSWTLQTSSLLNDNGGADGTYPLPVVLSDGTFYLFFRRYNSAERNVAYLKSTDGGATWNNWVEMVQWPEDGSNHRVYPTRPYVDSNENIWMTCCRTNGPGVPRFDQYVVYLDPSDDTVHDVTGAGFGTTVTKTEAQSTSNEIQAYDSGSNEVELASTAVVSGTPHILFGLNGGTWDYVHTYWDGSAWVSNEFLSSGAQFNYASLTARGQDTLNTYLTVSTDGNRGGDVEKWAYDESTWSKQALVGDSGDFSHDLGHPQYTENFSSSVEAVFSEIDVGSTTSDLQVFSTSGGGSYSFTDATVYASLDGSSWTEADAYLSQDGSSWESAAGYQSQP